MISKLQNILKENNLKGILITNPENMYYYTGVKADSTYFIVDSKGARVVTNFIYFDDIKSNINIEADVLMYKNTDLYDVFDKDTEYAFEANFMNVQSYNTFLKHGIKLKPVSNFVEKKIRSVKNLIELDKIQKAVDITDKAFKYVCENVKEGMSEIDVANMIFDIQRSEGAMRNSFETIAAVGENSSLPHAICSSERIVKKGEMLKLDFGCVYDNYCSDMTRTVFIGKATDKFKEIYNVVLKAQLAAIKAIKPGVKGADIDKVARDIITEAGYGDRFGHGLGHGVGIEVHEFPVLSPRSDDVLEEGNIVTVEPGVYLPGWGGIRIEDDVLVTADGYKILNSSTKDIIEI